MIEAKSPTKQSRQIVAADHTNVTIKDGSMFGLIGTNGAGKSTFLRMASRMLRSDEGSATIDGEPVFKNTRMKSRLFCTPDNQFFFNNTILDEMMPFYMTVYLRSDKIHYIHLVESFGLERKRKTGTFSKGMKRQVSVIYGVYTGTDYPFCNETPDGLDPVTRQTVKSIFVGNMQERNLTPIIASHNPRELEDTHDHMGLLHKGGILLSGDLDDMRLNIRKIQYVLEPDMGPEDLVALDKAEVERRGSLCTLTVRGTRKEVEALMVDYHPVFAETIPLSLEKTFISGTGVTGYDIKKLML